MVDRWVGTSWRAVEVDGVVLSGEATLSFDDAGRVSGSSGVNRFSGNYTVDGATLTIGPLAVTRMAGPPELMAQEAALLAALAEPLVLEDSPVLEPPELTEPEARLEGEGGVVLEDTLVLRGRTSVRLAPA